MAALEETPTPGCHNCQHTGTETHLSPVWTGCHRRQPNPGEITDRRSGTVALISHCLLNQNVRYLGGATHPGALPDVVEHYTAAGVGIYQMPCPEQHAWGGVLKPFMTRWYGPPILRLSTARKLIALVAAGGTWIRYRRLARRVVAANVVGRPGLFTSCLQAELRRNGVTVTFREHDLISELRQAGYLPAEPTGRCRR